MADAEHDEAAAIERPPPPEPRVVEYDRITGVPAVFNEYLPHDCAEWKRWKAAQEDGGAGGAAPEASAGDAAAEGVGALSLGEGGGEAAAAAAAGLTARRESAATPAGRARPQAAAGAEERGR